MKKFHKIFESLVAPKRPRTNWSSFFTEKCRARFLAYNLVFIETMISLSIGFRGIFG